MKLLALCTPRKIVLMYIYHILVLSHILNNVRGMDILEFVCAISQQFSLDVLNFRTCFSLILNYGGLGGF